MLIFIRFFFVCVCAAQLKFEMHFDKLRNSKYYAAEVHNTEQNGRDLSCYTFYARPDQESQTRSEWDPVFIILFCFLFLLFLFFIFYLFFHISNHTNVSPHPSPTATTILRPQGRLRSDWVMQRLLLCSSDVIYLVP